MMLSIFLGDYLPFAFILGKMAIQIFCPIFKWAIFLLLNFESSLYILNASPLSHIIYALQIFSPSL